VATRTVAEKIGARAGARTRFVNAPAAVVKLFGARHLSVAQRLVGEFDYLHVFVTKRSELEKSFPRLRRHLSPGGMLWVSWPKNGQLHTDLSLTKVIAIGYDHGLVESKTIGIDATWSALKFTHPKRGKRYNNSYGKLKKQPG
jgi:hypothetical protein